MSSRIRRGLAAGLLTMTLAAGVVWVSASEADARGRRGEASVETQRGTYTGQREIHRSRGARDATTSVRGPNGGARTTTDSRRWNRREGTYSRERETSFRDGSTRSGSTNVQRTGRGAYSAEREVTGRNGQTRTQSGDFVTTRTENGRSTSGVIDTSNRGTIDYARDVSRQGGVRTTNSSRTFEDGTSQTRSSTASCADGACASNTTLTGRQGGTRVIDQSRTRTETGAAYNRNTTFNDGTSRNVDYVREGNGDGSGAFTRTVTGRDGETRTQTGDYSVTPIE